MHFNVISPIQRSLENQQAKKFRCRGTQEEEKLTFTDMTRASGWISQRLWVNEQPLCLGSCQKFYIHIHILSLPSPFLPNFLRRKWRHGDFKWGPLWLRQAAPSRTISCWTPTLGLKHTEHTAWQSQSPLNGTPGSPRASMSGGRILSGSRLCLLTIWGRNFFGGWGIWCICECCVCACMPKHTHMNLVCMHECFCRSVYRHVCWCVTFFALFTGTGALIEPKAHQSG